MFLFSNKKLVLSEDAVRMYNGMLFNHKKENGAICTNMDGPEWSQTEKVKYRKMSLICGILKKMIQMNLQNRKSRT